MKKQYVIPTSEVREISLNSCIMSGGSGEPGGGTGGSQGELTPLPTGVAARRLYA